MPTISYQKFGLKGNRCSQYRYQDGLHSPKVNGKRVLVQNRLTDLNCVVKTFYWPDTLSYAPRDAQFSIDMQDKVELDWGPIDNVALAKFNGKVKYEKASLGITAVKWRQSVDMITTRLNQARKVLARGERRLKSLPPRRRPSKTESADAVLEYEFGWKSLYSDIKGAMSVLGSDIPPTHVTSRHRVYIDKTNVTGSGGPYDPLRVDHYIGYALSSLSSDVRVSNHNLWLLNKLGLINLPGIIWDALPWSFLVNMVVNTNQLINGVTDYVGLEMNNKSTTHTTLITLDHSLRHSAEPGFCRSIVSAKSKRRVVGSLPTATLEFRLPNVNLELCVIASALLVQQASRVTRLLR